MRVWNPWKGIGEQPREIWALGAATLVNRMGTMILPFLVLYLTRERHLSDAQAGAALAVYGAGALISSPVAGALSDRFGAIRVMIAALAGAGVVAIAFPLVRGFAPLLAASAVFALIAELVRPASLTIVSTWADPTRRKAAFAVNRLAVNLGMSVGPAIGGFLAAFSFPLIFRVDGTTSLLAAVMLAVALRGRPSHAPTRAAVGAAGGAAAPRSARALADPRLRAALLAIIPVGLVFFQIDSALPLFLVNELHLPARLYGLLFTMNTLIIVAVELPLNLAMARWETRRTLAVGAMLVGIGFGVLVFAGSLAMPVVIGSVLAWTFGEMILFPGLSSYVAEISPDDRRGEYMGLYSMSFGLCFALGPWLGTLALSRLGSTALWSICGGIGALSAVAMAMLPEARAATAEAPTRSAA